MREVGRRSVRQRRKLPSLSASSRVASDQNVVTSDPTGRASRRRCEVDRPRESRGSNRRGGRSLHSRRVPAVASDTDVVTSDRTGRKVFVGAKSNIHEGAEEATPKGESSFAAGRALVVASDQMCRNLQSDKEERAAHLTDFLSFPQQAAAHMPFQCLLASDVLAGSCFILQRIFVAGRREEMG
ncbi:hypothetical protein MA16_Dca019753 [Dendrobium catenatum]|uniref:Uncharacterized protein n=1 Tax=Dendrobium catenatum TaxID=906689 RepID=A0A2I0VQT0_9ASPA|nr:hypothetical protein MA16_Dca019753 [Dendrobium catenatum]